MRLRIRRTVSQASGTEKSAVKNKSGTRPAGCRRRGFCMCAQNRGMFYCLSIKRINCHKSFFYNFVENANTLQRFRFLSSVVYRSAFGSLQSKNDCGILRQRVICSSMNARFFFQPCWTPATGKAKDISRKRHKIRPTARGRENPSRCGKERI